MKELRGGRYKLLRTLGEGAQGETWEARDEGAARPDPKNLARDFDTFVRRAKGDAKDSPSPRGLVAIKCFRLGKAKAWKDVELAEREATTLAGIRHPNLPRYLDHFEEDGALYLVMEKIEGESLVPGKTRDVDVVRMLEDIGDALRYLHARTPPLVHRDVKPANIIRRLDGSYALVDFGAVRDRLKPSGGSTVVGTFGYMAPEQFQGRASAQSDLYGLGATVLAMMTGAQPEDLPHAGLGIDVKASVPKRTPRALTNALEAMLAPDPDHRAASIDEVLAMLHDKGKRKKKSRREKRKKRKGHFPLIRKPRPRRARASGPGALASLAIVAAALAAFFATGSPLVFVAMAAVFVFMGRLRRPSSPEAAEPAEPRIRVAEETHEDERRVRVSEESYEMEDDEEDERRSDKLRR